MSESKGSGFPRFLAWTIALLSGAAGMTVEVAAVRLLAPWFGTSVYVWTNIIGVTLFALALGAWLGGILAERSRPMRSLTVALGGGGGLALIVPFLSPWIAAELLPADLRLDEAVSILTMGSLGTALVVFAPPIFLMGAVTPLLVKLLTQGGSTVGRGSGDVWALSTFGSLIGTFGTTHVLVPNVGAGRTIAIAGGALLGLAMCVALAARADSRRSVTTVVVLLSSSLFGSLPLPANAGRTPKGARLIDARETPYQFARVIEFDGKDAYGEFRERHLQVNEGLDSFQSLAREGRVFTGAYYDALAFTALMLPEPHSRPWRVLVIGLGGGTVVPILHALTKPLDYPIELVGVEIDPGIVELSRTYLAQVAPQDSGRRPWQGLIDLSARSVAIYSGMDGRVALRHLTAPWDLILVDAYASQVHIPPHLASVEFFELARERLAPGGLIALNVGQLHRDDPVPLAIGNTLQCTLGSAWAWPVLENRNVILFGGGRKFTIDDGRRRAHERCERLLTMDLPAPFVDRLSVLDQGFRFPGIVDPVRPFDGPVLEDDRPRLDVLQMEALEGRGDES